ncbi:MAG TPA: 50S ribosomal protein L3 N(5)-glutamine methyltransferase [Steroidobacteraceae bacterium]|nr:50S ribosomal protein L3 N(5)-glutamine methyltransferase [Steroidobacteraceae bacterium]
MPPRSTVADEIRRLALRLFDARVTFGHGTDNAWDDAAALVLHAAGLPLESSTEVYAKAVTARVRERIRGLARRRIRDRVPTPYLIGRTFFAGLPFKVDRRALIPRSPIAELIEARFRPWLAPGRVRRILDIGTGGGCIAVACARYFPRARVVATDISTAALALAAVNARALRVRTRLRLRRADLFPAAGEGPFDLIVANPPYVGTREYAALPLEYRREPATALCSGRDGLDAVRRILARARTFLTRAGILIVEVGNSDRALAKAFPRVPFLWLEFARGGGGVFLLTRAELERHAADFEGALDD